MMFYCWGDSSKGQLALPGTGVKATPTSVHLTEQLIQISCGEHHTLFLTPSGQVLSCGRNSKGQLGRSKSRDTKLPVKIEGLGSVAAIACGQDHSLALCDSGQVFSWGAGGEGQLGLRSPVAKCLKPMLSQIPFPIQVVQVACGNFHSLALTKGGEVFSWGLNKYGQLGLGKSVDLQHLPALILSLVGVPVVQISAGGSHTMALTLTDQVFCCGANSVGQLGLNRIDEKGRFTICAVPALRNFGVSSISCGAAHTAVLTKVGEVYTFGEGAHGQLGHNSTNNQLLPKKVEGIDAPAKQVTCGSHHTLVLMPSGMLFTFGRDAQAQASGGTENSLQPVRLDGDWISSGAGIPTKMQISSGYSSNFLFFPTSKTNILGEPIGKLEEAQVQRWLTMLDCERSIKEMKKEVSMTFATSSNLVACFIKDRNSPGTLQVDVNAASQTFDQILKIPWIKNSVNFTQIVEVLLHAAKWMRCPEVFLLLPTCSILHEQQNVIGLVLPLAVAITYLNENAMKILKEQWSSMDANIMTKHVRMWKQALAFLLSSNVWVNYEPGVKAVLEVLKLLYRANKRAKKSRRIPFSEFYIEEIGTTPQLLECDVLMWMDIRFGLVKEEDATSAIFCLYPFLLDLTSKISVFKYIATAVQVLFRMELRRTALLEDCFRCLRNASEQALKGWLQVVYCENFVQSDVNKRDFFHNAFKMLLDPESKMFMYNDTKTVIWFPVELSLPEDTYFFLGLLCGLAFYNNSVVPIPIPLALFKKLLDIEPTLDDFAEISPVEAQSLRYIRDYSDDDAENMGVIYTIMWNDKQVELDPDEPGKAVTSSNKNVFVDTYVDYVLNKSVERVFNEFKKGFYKVCERSMVNLFQPEELRGVMLGSEEYEWDVFKKNATYEPVFDKEHPTIVLFWEVFDELSDQDKKAFLLFVTGFDRVPIVGMVQVKMRVRPLFYATQDYLPQALTCHTILDLPIYQSKEILQMKLTEAIHHKRGFWED
ncbi:probable E3 ubiquitin-protein ligase HERC6 isoform X2 [Tachysurus ichikawai]